MWKIEPVGEDKKNMEKECITITRMELSKFYMFIEENEIPIMCEEVFDTSIYLSKGANYYLSWDCDTEFEDTEILERIIKMINALLPFHELELLD